MVLAILAALVGINLLVLIHELGHFLVARASDIPVKALSVGLGPVLWRVPVGDTEFQLRLIPLGGFIQVDDKVFLDERVPLWRRMLLAGSGPLANLLLAAGLFFGAAMLFGVPATLPPRIAGVADGAPHGAEVVADKLGGERITKVGETSVESWPDVLFAIRGVDADSVRVRTGDGSVVWARLPADPGVRQRWVEAFIPGYPVGTPILVGRVFEDSPAARAGLLKDDMIRQVEGQPVDALDGLVKSIRSHLGQSLRLGIQRDDRSLQVTVSPIAHPQTGTGWIGVSPRLPSPKRSVAGAVEYSASMVARVLPLIKGDVGALVQGRASVADVGGPLAVARVLTVAANVNPRSFLVALGVVSLLLVVFNLLPIPALDGGHLLLMLGEVVTGRPASESMVQILNASGAALIGLLLGTVLLLDALRLWDVPNAGAVALSAAGLCVGFALVAVLGSPALTSLRSSVGLDGPPG